MNHSWQLLHFIMITSSISLSELMKVNITDNFVTLKLEMLSRLIAEISSVLPNHALCQSPGTQRPTAYIHNNNILLLYYSVTDSNVQNMLTDYYEITW